MELKKVINSKKQSFDHSNSFYYQLTLENGKKLLFTASELNKALHRYQKWSIK